MVDFVVDRQAVSILRVEKEDDSEERAEEATMHMIAVRAAKRE